MSEDETYNGWKNYPTWAVNLWLTNNQGLDDEALEAVRLVHERITEPDEYMTVQQIRRFEIAEGLKRWVEDDLLPDLGATMEADLLGWAVAHVDWYEIADDFTITYEEMQDADTV